MRQLQLFSNKKMEQMGTTAYHKLKKETPISTESTVNQYAKCVTHHLTKVLTGEATQTKWEITVFNKDQINAFALPGGKIGVYKGLFKVATNQDQLAAVIGHEIGHVLAEHANARVSMAYATGTGLQLIQILAGARTQQQQQLFALLGIGAEFGVIRPYSRSQESEADILGLKLMARAGFAPQESIPLWRNMAQAGGKRPPELLSTHPAPKSRITTLQSWMPEATQLYKEAQSQGRQPQCTPPT